MANNRDKRVSDLEKDTGGGTQIRARINWRTDGLIEDEDTGKFVTPDEWKRRHPNDRLIIVTWDDDWDDDDYTAEPVPVA